MSRENLSRTSKSDKAEDLSHFSNFGKIKGLPEEIAFGSNFEMSNAWLVFEAHRVHHILKRMSICVGTFNA